MSEVALFVRPRSRRRPLSGASEVELPEVPLAVENRTLMILREHLRPN